MANPLQPKVIKYLKSIGGFTVNVTAAGVSGVPDVIACINGDFWAFEVKWRTDTPSDLQRKKINAIIDAGGRAFFVRSIEELKDMISLIIEPVRYDIKIKYIL